MSDNAGKEVGEGITIAGRLRKRAQVVFIANSSLRSRI